MRFMESILCKTSEGYEFEELKQEDFVLVYPLYLALYEHYRESPFFMNRTPASEKEFLVSSGEDEGRYFVAKQNDKLCAFVKIAAVGETFVARGAAYCH